MTFDDDWGYPKEPIPVGHQWSLTPEQLGQFLGFTGLNAAEGAASFEFERIVDCGSDQCAQVAAKVRLTGFMPDGSGSQMGITLDGSGTVLRSLRDRIDREAELSGQMEMQQSAPLAGGQVRVTVSGPFTFTGQASVRVSAARRRSVSGGRRHTPRYRCHTPWSAARASEVPDHTTRPRSRIV